MSKSQGMQSYRPTTESTDLRQALDKRGLGAMNPKHVGANYFDGGSVASFDDPRLTTSIAYKEQNMGQNMLTDISGKTVEAARDADLEIIDASQQVAKANEYARMAKAYEMEKPGMDSSSTRMLSDPSTANKVFQDVAAINLQGKAIRQNQMFA